MSFEGKANGTGMHAEVFSPVFQTGIGILAHMMSQRFWVQLAAALGDDCAL